MTGGDDSEDEFLDAFDRREAERIDSDLERKLADRIGGPAEVERKRVAEIIARDRADRLREHERRQATLEVSEGVFVNLADTAIEPTPEWMEKGDVRPFTPKQPDGTVRTLKTVRRVVVPIVVRMHRSGKITDDQASACIWYRSVAMLAGMEGKCASSQWNPNSTIRRGTVDAGFGYVPASEAIAVARDAYRKARNALPRFYIKFFEKIVLDDVPLRRAARFAKCGDHKAPRRFRDVAQALADYRERKDIHIGHDYGRADA